MLSRFFKKRDDAAAPASPAASPAAPTAASAPAARARQAEEARAAWQPRLEAARGDDAALLLVACGDGPWEIKLAAVEALAGEEALKQAERELRQHDSRVHRAARRRHAAAVAQRETRARAQGVIAAASALAGEYPLPANRLVALDRDWQALDASLLADAQRDEFQQLRERLNGLLHAQGEAERAQREQQRQQADAEQALQAAAAAAQAERLAIAAAAQAEQTALAAQAAQASALSPEAPPPAAPRKLSNEQRQQIEGLLAQAEAALAEGQLAAMQQHLQSADDLLEGLKGLKLPDALRSRHQALHAERGRLKGWQQWGGARALDALVAEAEALAQLTLAAAGPQAADSTVSAPAVSAPTESALTESAPTESDPAASDSATSDPESPGTSAPTPKPSKPPKLPKPPRPPKLRLKEHADTIQQLRKRWKEIDRLGAPTHHGLWLRFDAALHIAYQPVGVQQEALKAQRADNERARTALLDALDALPQDEVPAEADAAARHWKERAQALQAFQLGWRQLGPLEHTVPAASRAGLQQRMQASVARLEAPLQAARRGAEAERERLIQRAEALLQEQARPGAARDLPARVRELQAQWQQQARALPLARAAENALWARFKAATDAVFAQRQAVFNARDAELAANLAAREALLQQLEVLDLAAGSEQALQAGLAEVDRAWRGQPLELPRAAAGAIEARFRDARAAVVQAITQRARQQWQSSCDTLAAKLALCEERGALGAEPAADWGERWLALPALPPPWEHALAQRVAGQTQTQALSAVQADEALLLLEAALELPATPEQQAARRDLKLRAMKDALEGRKPVALDPAAQRAQGLLDLLGSAGLAEAQRQRLQALVQALGQAAPGTFLVARAAGRR